MPIVQDQLIPQNTSITFEDINNTRSDRILHNTSDFIKFELLDRPTNPLMIYYTTAGARAASYSLEGDYILDVSREPSTGKYYQLRHRIDEQIVTYIDPQLSFGDTFSTSGYTNTFWYPQGHVNGFSYVQDGLLQVGDTSTVSGEHYESYSVSTGGIVADRLSIYQASIDYNFKLAGITGTSGCSICLSVQDKPEDFFSYDYVPTDRIDVFSSTSNVRYLVGATNSPSSQKKFKIAVSGTEDNSTTSGHHIYGLHFKSDIVNFLNFATISPIAVNLYYNGTVWEVTYSGSSSISGNTNSLSSPNPYTYHGPYFGFALYPEISGTIGDTLSFSIFTNSFNDSAASGTLEITRSGTGSWLSSTYSTNLDPSYTITYGLSDYNAKEYSDFRLDVISSQPGTVGIELDNFIVKSGNTQNYHTLALDEILFDGQINQTIVNRLDLIPSTDIIKSYEDIVTGLGNIGTYNLAIDSSGGAFVKVKEDIYRINISGTYTPSSYYDESSINIDVASGIIVEKGITSFSFNAENFLQYLEYDSNTTEVMIKTLDIVGSGAPIASDSKLFLAVSDWAEFSGTKPYQFVLHGTDNNTLFYFRQDGVGEVNSVKSSGTNGQQTGNLFVSIGATFETSNVKPGDIVELTKGSTIYTVVDNVINETSMLISGTTFSGQTGITYTIRSNAELLQFTVDPDIAAFSSINVDDFSLRAGTTETTNVKTEVINAWGEPLNGKKVTLSVIQGDGVILTNPVYTNVSGIATTQYLVGNTAGPVQIQAIIEDS